MLSIVTSFCKHTKHLELNVFWAKLFSLSKTYMYSWLNFSLVAKLIFSKTFIVISMIIYLFRLEEQKR
jgi:predicted membrane protein